MEGLAALRESDRQRVVAAVGRNASVDGGGGSADESGGGADEAASTGADEVASTGAAAAAVEPAPSILPSGVAVSAALPRGYGSNIPQRLWSALYPFQREGVTFGLRVAGRVLIGDEMGLGKTLQGLALACAYRQQWPCLILAPASMCLQWADELEKCAIHTLIASSST